MGLPHSGGGVLSTGDWVQVSIAIAFTALILFPFWFMAHNRTLLVNRAEELSRRRHRDVLIRIHEATGGYEELHDISIDYHRFPGAWQARRYLNQQLKIARAEKRRAKLPGTPRPSRPARGEIGRASCR